MKVRFTEQAESDLARLADHIAESSPQRAVSFIGELRESGVSIADFPESHPLVGRYEEWGIRRKVHGNYLIFFKIGKDGIDIIHILHGAMDYDAILFP